MLLLLSGKTWNCSGLPEVEVINIIELQRSILFLRNAQVEVTNNLLSSWILCQVQAEDSNATYTRNSKLVYSITLRSRTKTCGLVIAPFCYCFHMCKLLLKFLCDFHVNSPFHSYLFSFALQCFWTWMRGNFGQFCSFCPKLPHIHVQIHYNANEKS